MIGLRISLRESFTGAGKMQKKNSRALKKNVFERVVRAGKSQKGLNREIILLLFHSLDGLKS